MKPNRSLVIPMFVILVLAATVIACGVDLGLPAQAPPQVITVVVPPTLGPAIDTPIPPAAPTDTPRPTDTPTPTSTATLTPSPTLGPAMFTASEKANCRWGPSTVYPVRAGINRDQTVPIVAKTDTSWLNLWWVVQVSGLDCWVSADLGTTSGDVSQVISRVAPPTPTPKPPIPQACDGAAHYGPIDVGTQVILGRHREINGDDNWDPAMDAYVGVQTKVGALSGVDAEGCTGVRVEADGGTYFWRVRDMKLP